MTFTKTLMMTAAVAVLSTAAIAADGSKNTDGTHNANNTQTDTNMGNPALSNDAAAHENTNASTEAEMSDSSNDVSTSSTTNTGVSSTSSANLAMSDIQEVQSSLKSQGYSVSADGIWGPRTSAALKEFQAANGLRATGTVNSETLAALNISQ